MNRTRTLLSSTLAMVLLAAATGSAAARDAFSVEVTLDTFVPAEGKFRMEVKNRSRGEVEIKSVELSIGNSDKNFDAAYQFTHTNVDIPVVMTPDMNDAGVLTDDRIIVNFTGFDPGENVSWYVDIDPDAAPIDPRRVLFNNNDKPNAILTIVDSNDEIVNISLPDGPAGQTSYTFNGGANRRKLKVESRVEVAFASNGVPITIYVDDISVFVNPVSDTAAVAPDTANIPVYTLDVYDGDVVRITAPQDSYRDLQRRKLTSSVLSDSAAILESAEEKFTAKGISVNNLAQTGDPTLYEFTVEEDTTAVVKWDQYFALRVESDFSETDSSELEENGDTWAGPLESQAIGGPIPLAGTVQWVLRDTPQNPQLGGSYVDQLRHPGLNIRFVPYAYVVSGAANKGGVQADYESMRDEAGVPDAFLAARRNDAKNSFVSASGKLLRSRLPFTNGGLNAPGQSPPPVYQLQGFTMSGPAEIRYIWKIQYGVEVNTDPGHESLPKIYGPGGKNYSGSGVFWFDQDVEVSVASASKESAAVSAQALTGWFSGDGYFFDSSGKIDGSNGTLTSGLAPMVDGNPTATWKATGIDATAGSTGNRGMHIPKLRRPAKLIWTYSGSVIKTDVTVGEYVFQNNPAFAGVFKTPPTVRANPAPTVVVPEQGVWDPEAAKFYPLVAGVAGKGDGVANVFSVNWRPEGGAADVQVDITVRWPTEAHYPHVAGTPAVALDPDPDDDFLFKEMKYSESGASINDLKQFVASGKGRSVLLFGNIQRNGLGQPREFLQVRVVETKTIAESIANAAAPEEVTIGEKIRDRALDLAQLGTGYVVNSDSPDTPTKARYNPFIYDPVKLIGIAAKDVYDTALLFSDTGQKRVVDKSVLPGPIIPVNEFPDVAADDILRVVWYDDPAQNDGLLWPHEGRSYKPKWSNASGLTTTELKTITGSTASDAFGKSFARLSGAAKIALDGQLAYAVSPQTDGLSIVDVTDPFSPRLISEVIDGAGEFNDLDGAIDVVVQDGFAFVVATADKAVTIIDVSNPVSPRFLSMIKDGVGGFDKLDGARTLAVSGDLLFVGADADGAVTIVDISDPTRPLPLGTATVGRAGAIAVDGGVLYATSESNLSLYLFDISDPGVPTLLAQRSGLSGAFDIVVEDGYAYIAGGTAVDIFSVSDPLLPSKIGNTPSVSATAISLDGGYLFTVSNSGSSVLDVGDPRAPKVIPNLVFNVMAKDVVVSDDLMLLAGRVTGTAVADLATYSVASNRVGRIVIASQWGSESEDSAGSDQAVAPPAGGFGRATTFDPSRLQQASIYNQPDRSAPGFNPNEEHGLMAPSLRYAQVSPRPLAAYALRDNDLNVYTGSRFSANMPMSGNPYTSDPFVLVQYFDVAEEEFKMNVYKVQAQDTAATGAAFEANYKFATIPASPTANLLAAQPYVRMEAGEPVIPFYPIGFVDGAVPCPNTFGTDLLAQNTYWEDHRGSNWAISGGDNAWFVTSPSYRMSPNFWWPENANGSRKPGALRETTEEKKRFFAPGSGENVEITFTVASHLATGPQTGDCVTFLPQDVTKLLATVPDTVVRKVGTAQQDSITGSLGIPIPLTAVFKKSFDIDPNDAAKANVPTKILYKSDWPDVVPVLKAGETLTFSGGEFRADHPQMTIADFEGNLRTIDTPGLPQVTAFASAEVVFDSLNPAANESFWKTSWSARVAQVLDVRQVNLKVEDFPPALQPANGKTRVSGGKYAFVDLPASLQNRVRYNPLAQYVENIAPFATRTGALEVIGLLNDKDIGDPSLTAPPPAVYVLEPNILTDDDRNALKALVATSSDTTTKKTQWDAAVDKLFAHSRNPNGLTVPNPAGSPTPATPIPFWVGLDGKSDVDTVTGEVKMVPIELGSTVMIPKKLKGIGVPERALGSGLALIPNGDFMNPTGTLPGTSTPYPDVSYVTVMENNDPSFGGLPITPHVIKIDRRERYRGSIKTVESDNVFDENLVLRHTGDFGTNADDLFFDWWYRPDDGSLNVPPPDLIPSGQTNPWKVFPDDSGKQGKGRYGITLKGNPNAPEVLIADTFWFVRYRHKNEEPDGTNWNKHEIVSRGSGNKVASNRINFTWAGAGNSQPFEDFDLDGIPDFRAQLAQGWIKRVLDAVNPYEARIRDFNGDNPATVTSMLQQFGPRFEGPVALNPDKNVIENVGLIELYETILKRGRDLTIDLSRPVASPAIANALQLASTRISDFYTVLGNEAYVDSLDPTIGIDGGSIPPSIFSFQNQASDLLEEELGMLRGVDDFFARPVYNRMFWNFTKGEGEAAYALNYNISDINQDGFINEDDAMILYPQGHGDAWGHYLTALRNQFELLQQPFFNWVSRSEFYNLQDIVIKVDFLDERKFAETAAAKAKTGAEIVSQTYRDRYVDDPQAQWQGYTDSNEDRAWGVQGWARRAGQGALFDWATANALLPSEHPNETLEGVQKVDRTTNDDIKVISANLNAIQQTFDEANQGNNPLGLPRDAVVFDIDPEAVDGAGTVSSIGHFDQIYQRAVGALDSARAIWNNANEDRNRLRNVANSELAFRNATFQEDLSYRNQLIKIFGKPYAGTVGPGQLYPAGYDGPDLGLYMYVSVREITKKTVPGPTAAFATFDGNGNLSGGALRTALSGVADREIADAEDNDISDILDEDYSAIFSSTFANATNSLNYDDARNGLFSVDYTDLVSPKVPLTGLQQSFPVKAAGYTFQAPNAWGARPATGELQILINRMVQQEASIAAAIGAWDGLQGAIVREAQIISARLDSSGRIRQRNKEFESVKFVFDTIIQAIEVGRDVTKTTEEIVIGAQKAAKFGVPTILPIVGVAAGPGDALSAARAGFEISTTSTKAGFRTIDGVLKIAKLIEEIGISAYQLGVTFANDNDALTLSKKEWLKGLEDLAGDEPVLRIAVFKEIQALRQLSDQYRSLLDEGSRLVDERQAFNKRVAAQTQRERYQDFTFRVSRNHALQTYRDAFDLAARYAYLAAKAYDYETNFAPGDPGSPSGVLADIVSTRGLGNYSGGPQSGAGGIGGSLAWLKTNFDSQRGQLGINNPQLETGKMSLRTEMKGLMPSDGGGAADAAWTQFLERSYVDDLWLEPEFRTHCRTFTSERNAAGEHVPQPGLVIRFPSQIIAGNNFFGRSLKGGDHAYDASNYATKINGAGIWFSDYDDDLMVELPAAPRVYLIPAGTDIMTIPTAGASSTAGDELYQRLWNVVDASIPIPIPATQANLDSGAWVPAIDGLNGGMGRPRKFSSFRAYHDGTDAIDDDELVFDNRLVGRSVWNTEWVLIIPGLTLNADPDEGLRRFIQQVSDIKLVFKTYGYRGN